MVRRHQGDQRHEARDVQWTDPVCRSTTSESVVDMTGGKLAFSVDRTFELGAVTVVA
jgi:hypothetical protein